MTKISISIGSIAIALMIISPVQALPTTEPQILNRSDYTISPRQLISLARQGQFKAQGISSHNNFRQGIRTVTTEVEADANASQSSYDDLPHSGLPETGFTRGRGDLAPRPLTSSAFPSVKITARILVESAIADKRLPANVREDSNYLETVDNHLKSGGCGS